MSAISTYLEHIRSKIYARDVRTAIVNAISQCYNDVNAPALQTEAMEAAVQAKIDAGQMAALTIADGSLTGAKLANGTIPTAKIADGAVTTVKIADGAVTGAKVGTGTLIGDNIANKAIGTTKIDDGAVTWQKLASGAVHTGELADGAVTNAKLADSSVSEEKLASSAVTTTKLADGAVTGAKLADGAVTASKIASGVIPNTDTTLAQSGSPADAKAVGDALARKVSTVNGVEPDATGNVTVSPGGGIDSDGITKLIEILNEGLYGTNQSDNIVLLNNILRGHSLVSISATYEGAPPFVGTPYDELDFTVTATYSDSSTAILSTYMVSSGTVVDGTNTVTISFGGMSTTVTFTGSSVRTYSITYNLAGVTSSNNATLVAENDSYSSVLSAMPDYTFSACTVTMNGVDVTSTVYSNQEILIQEVTGNVVITASAIQNVYLDALIPTAASGSSTTYIYSDYFATQMAKFFYHGLAYVTEYPFANASRLKWTLTNTSEGSVNIGNLYLGGYPSDDASYRTGGALYVAYGMKIANNGNTLEAGHSLTGYYDVRAGYQLVFVTDNQIKDDIELKLQGEYTPMSLSGYTKIQTASNITSGSYRKVTWYSDAGVTELASVNTQKFTVFDNNLSAGTYDVIMRIVSPTCDGIGVSAAGAVDISDGKFTAVNNSTGVNYPQFNVFYGGLRLVVADGSYTMITSEYTLNKKIMELYVKEVTS